MAAALAKVDADAQRLVTVALDVLQLAQARRHRQPCPLADLGDRVTGAAFARQLQRALDKLLEVGAGMGESVVHGAVLVKGALIIMSRCRIP